MQLLASDTSDPENAAVLGEFDRAAHALEDLETMPSVARQILAATSNPDCTIADIQELITTDPVLAARVLRVANSAVYRARKGCSLQEALVRIGLRDIRHMAVAAALVSAHGGKRRFTRDFWTYSLRVATHTSALCAAAKIGDVADPFLCGLLHDFGTLLLARVRGRTYEKLVGAPGSEGQSDREIAELHFDHCDIGALIANEWDLGESYEYVMLLHHSPQHAALLGLPVDVLHAVNLVALAHIVVSGGDDAQRASLLDALGLDEERVAAANSKAQDDYAELASKLLK